MRVGVSLSAVQPETRLWLIPHTHENLINPTLCSSGHISIHLAFVCSGILHHADPRFPSAIIPFMCLTKVKYVCPTPCRLFSGTCGVKWGVHVSIYAELIDN